jgi:hypothetical protein
MKLILILSSIITTLDKETQEHVELVHKVLTVGTNFWNNLEVIQNHHFLSFFIFLLIRVRTLFK